MTARHITILSSKERCGIQTYSATLAEALRRLGHRVDLVGIGWWDSGALLREAGRVAPSSDVVIVEHEFALYRNAALALAMARLRFAGKSVLLSMHELDPDKFWNYHKVVAALHYQMRGSALGDLARILWATLEAAQRMLRYRLTLWLLGAFADRIVFHSPRARANAGLVTGDERKVVEIPHFVEPLPGVRDPGAGDPAARKRELRDRLGLPLERFIFVSPGFLFRRKRLIEVIAAAPPDALIVLAGTESPHEREGYLEEIRRYVAEHELRSVVIDTDYDHMPDHLLAADAVVLFYKDAFQSGIASHAIWAEQPCIFSSDPAFDMYGGAGLRASSTEELRPAMAEIQRPEVADRLREEARRLKRELSPEAMARLYVEAIPS
ncbi:MAG: glycosyltransferase family 4 protein [Chloroflexi bacterium]|nr:glycosyltransferase family 4 protein [Chloroflexota bacterium]